MSEMSFDTNGDGYVDEIGIDANADGVLDTVGFDANEDGIAESVETDTNFDGAYDVIGSDANEDGIPDYVARDTDFDGVLDSTVVDANEDGLDDRTQSWSTVGGQGLDGGFTVVETPGAQPGTGYSTIGGDGLYPDENDGIPPGQDTSWPTTTGSGTDAWGTDTNEPNPDDQPGGWNDPTDRDHDGIPDSRDWNPYRDQVDDRDGDAIPDGWDQEPLNPDEF